jgi:hypothetical protein
MHIAAHAQVPNMFMDPKIMAAPDVLAPYGQTPVMQDIFYLIDSAFSHEALTQAEGRLKIPDGVPGKIYVRYESPIITETIKLALKQRGLDVVDSPDEAAVQMTGRIMYRAHLHPNVQRSRWLDAKFDADAQMPSLAMAGPRKQNLADAIISVGGAAPSAAVNPVQFAGNLIGAVLDLTGIGSSIDRATEWNKKQTEEQFGFNDCYDQVTRKVTCEPGRHRNGAYLYKTRTQMVDITTYFDVKGQSRRKVDLVVRRIDSRNATTNDLPVMLPLAVNELVAGLGVVPQAAPVAPALPVAPAATPAA